VALSFETFETFESFESFESLAVRGPDVYCAALESRI
jgi:hypothetical protein